ncbi:PH domain-containing protein [Serratia fonticola]|uniref:PH domain-containing protein n=1 Tax=Serratia fonticola TaxID=47917 RepID=UPI003AB03DDB
MIDFKTATKSQLSDEFKRLSALVGDAPIATKKEFYHLPEILRHGEQVIAIASGSMDGNTWLIALTEKRVILLDKGMLWGVKQVDVNLEDIVSVGAKTGMILGNITISTSGQNYTILNVYKKAVIPFTNLVNEAKDKIKKTATNHTNNKSTESPLDIVGQLERLASLKEKGILSESEFIQQKTKILSQ